MLPKADKLLEIIALQGDVVRLGLDLGGVMQLVVDRLPALLGADGAAIELAEGEHMVYRAASGIAGCSLGLRVDRRRSLSGLCVERAELLVCDDAEQDPRVDLSACRRVGLRSMLVLPLFHAGQPVGVLKAMAARVAGFSAAERALLTLLADVVAASMFHATRYAADDLYYRATHDALTGLANRALFMDRLRNQLLQGDRDGQAGALLLIDMDGLKAINDGHGHRCGDAALVELGRRLDLHARVSDTVARLGGDEFGLLLRPIEGDGGLEAALLRLRAAIALPFRAHGAELPLGASIGHALFPQEGVDAELLLELADQRMYEEKRSRAPARASVF